MCHALSRAEARIYSEKYIVYLVVQASIVLTYVCHSRDTSDFTSIVRVCKEFYSADEIRAAKKPLWKYGDKRGPTATKMKKGSGAIDRLGCDPNFAHMQELSPTPKLTSKFARFSSLQPFVRIVTYGSYYA